MTTYVWLTDLEKDIVGNFNKNGKYFSVICTMPWGDAIIDNLNDPEYIQLRDQLVNAKRVIVDDNGIVVSGVSPSEVPLWCLRTVLKLINLFTQVEAAINAMPESTTAQIQLKTAAKEGLEYGNTVGRNSATTLFVQQALSLTDDQVDQIFINSNKINA